MNNGFGYGGSMSVLIELSRLERKSTVQMPDAIHCNCREQYDLLIKI